MSDIESSCSGEDLHEGLKRLIPEPGTGVGEYAMVGVGLPGVLFAECPLAQRFQSSEEVFRQIQIMRGKEFMRDKGLVWATGTGRKSQGRKLQWRLQQSTSFVAGDVMEPSLEELMQYVNARFPELAEQITVEPFHIDAANRSPQQGRWFKMIRRLAPFRGILRQVASVGFLYDAKMLGVVQ